MHGGYRVGKTHWHPTSAQLLTGCNGMSRDVTSLWYRRHQGWKKQWNEKLPGHRFHQAKPILKLHFTSHDKRSCPDSSHSDSVPVEHCFRSKYPEQCGVDLFVLHAIESLISFMKGDHERLHICYMLIHIVHGGLVRGRCQTAVQRVLWTHGSAF